jgi:hypothetical protein
MTNKRAKQCLGPPSQATYYTNMYRSRLPRYYSATIPILPAREYSTNVPPIIPHHIPHTIPPTIPQTIPQIDGWLAGWLTGRLAGWLDIWLAGWLIGWLAGWLAFHKHSTIIPQCIPYTFHNLSHMIFHTYV